MPTPSRLCSQRTSTAPMAQASRYQKMRRAVRLRSAGRRGRPRRQVGERASGGSGGRGAGGLAGGWRGGSLSRVLSSAAVQLT